MTAAVTQMQALQKEKAPVDEQKTTQEQQAQAAGQQAAHWQGQVNRLKGEIEFKAAMEKVASELDSANQVVATQDIALQEVEKKLAGVEQEVAAQKANKQAAEQKAAEVRQRMYELQGIAK